MRHLGCTAAALKIGAAVCAVRTASALVRCDSDLIASFDQVVVAGRGAVRAERRPEQGTCTGIARSVCCRAE